MADTAPRLIKVSKLKITKAIILATKKICKSALKLEKLTGRNLGITGEVGELLICNQLAKKFGLSLVTDQLSGGFDAIDRRGKTYQIKTKKGYHDFARLSKFSSHKFDYALLGILSKNYELEEIYLASFKVLKSIIEKHKRRNPTVKEFKGVAKMIWSI